MSFSIVAIGASAGGLEAYTELFHILPPDTGMAFVVIQHLDPSHHSMLTELIGKATKMPVEEVKSGVAIRPNHIYVIPPNRLMTLENYRFRLSKRSTTPGERLAVNFFMRSLADEEKSRAIGIVLSGTGTDGTLGLEEIKVAGGITFAQDPATAKYDGMPRSAIDSGCVDFVLSPGEIAKEIQRIQHHPFVHLGDGPTGRSEEEQAAVALHTKGQDTSLVSILGELRKSSGVDFSQYKFNTIHRRALRRMVVLKLDSLSDYAEYLKEHSEEAEKLFDDVLIPVTSFFRDFQAFEALKTHVYPAIVKDRSSKRTIRMWAPGCSTGEETYSLAMTLLEFLGDRAPSFQVQIFGTDLNDKGIQKARAGLYRETIADEISPERIRRFFSRVDEGYQINKVVRDMCIFARQNLAADPPFSQMNLVACRNLLIYIQPALQKKIIPILHYALKPSGFLILGSSESVSNFPDLFSTVDKKHKIYAKRMVTSRLHYDFAQPYYPAYPIYPTKDGQTVSNNVSKPSQIPMPARDEMAAQAEADRVVLEHHAPTGVLIDSGMEVIQYRGRTTPYLEAASGKPSLNVLKLARNGLAIELRTLIAAAAKKGTTSRKEGFRFDADGRKQILNLSVTPLAGKHFFLVLFEDVTPIWTAAAGSSAERKTKATSRNEEGLRRLRQELAETRDALRSTIDSEETLKQEFQSANEEILSANEELQSANEELETSKEELQSSNEELNTLNTELRHKNNELHELNNDIANFLNSTRIPVVMLDRHLRIRRLTPTAGQLLKALPSDINRPLADIRPNIEAPALEEWAAKVLEDLQPVEREVRDLQGQWHSLNILPYRTQDNKIDGVVMTLQDINAVKSAGDLSRKSAELFEAVVNTVRGPLLALDAGFKVITANQAFVDTFKVSQRETLGQSLFSLGNGQWEIPALRALLDQVLPKEGVVTDFKVEHSFENIGPRKMLLNARRLMHPDQSQQMILLAIDDITERAKSEEGSRKLQQLLDQQRQIYLTTLSSISDFAYTFDRNGRFLYANKPLLNLWGLTLEEAVGKNFHDLNYEDELVARLQGEVQQVIDTGKSVSGEIAYINPRGEPGYYEYIFNPVFGADGRVDLVAGSTHDLTAHKEAEAALIKSEKLAAAIRLAATLAHEINNPLQSITNLVVLLQRSPKLDAEDRAYANTVADELGRVTHLTRQSLSFYRERVSPTEIDVDEVVGGILDLYAARIAAKKIVFTAQLETGGSKINSYPAAIRQVLSTLLTNATEAVEDRGAIAVRVSRSWGWRHVIVPGIRITIADNGSGISPHNITRVFEPFFTTKGERGTGLGLWVAQDIINRLGGSIRVRSSVRPGKSGTSFSIFLPAVVPEANR